MSKMTKAELVRAMIFGAKAQGQTADALIAGVMDQFGFARQLARTYIKNNWDKVAAPIVVAVETVETAVEAVPAQQNKTLSMSKDAIRKRLARARAAAAKAAQAVA